MVSGQGADRPHRQGVVRRGAGGRRVAMAATLDLGTHAQDRNTRTTLVGARHALPLPSPRPWRPHEALAGRDLAVSRVGYQLHAHLPATPPPFQLISPIILRRLLLLPSPFSPRLPQMLRIT